MLLDLQPIHRALKRLQTSPKLVALYIAHTSHPTCVNCNRTLSIVMCNVNYQLLYNHDDDVVISEWLPQFTKESSVETVKSSLPCELLHRESSTSSDLPTKSTPTKRRRKRRPRHQTGSPKSVSGPRLSQICQGPKASGCKSNNASVIN